ncbi:Hypothetical predicted protein [Podarcis lilfordi]|uniref:Uncharacterized protein n=1 Tax=Podarcis lilfordi TaxID=74358 RepID=A0AA35L551_9SAUR|nr:Hypothetical predicted protein [Podarcis lilfordi]
MRSPCLASRGCFLGPGGAGLAGARLRLLLLLPGLLERYPVRWPSLGWQGLLFTAFPED